MYDEPSDAPVKSPPQGLPPVVLIDKDVVYTGKCSRFPAASRHDQS